MMRLYLINPNNPLVSLVMGGIHATMCSGEALGRLDSIVTGEAESVWAHVLEDAQGSGDSPSWAFGSPTEGENTRTPGATGGKE